MTANNMNLMVYGFHLKFIIHSYNPTETMSFQRFN